MVAFLFEEKPNERERESPAKNDDQNASSSLLASERGMDVPCETLSKTSSFVCTQHSRWWVCLLFFFFVLFLGFQKKREKKEEGKKEGDCVTVFFALLFAPSAPASSHQKRSPPPPPPPPPPLVLFEEEEDDSKRVAQTVLHGALFFCFVSLSLEHSCDF